MIYILCRQKRSSHFHANFKSNKTGRICGTKLYKSTVEDTQIRLRFVRRFTFPP